MSEGNRFCTKCGKALPEGATFCPYCGASASPGTAPQAQAPLSGMDSLLKEGGVQEYWLRRLAAFVVDAIIVCAVVGVLALLFAFSFLLAAGPAVFWAVLAGAFSVVSGVILVLYFMFADAYAGATIGKKALGLRVIASGGRTPTIGEAAIRNISKIYWVLLLLDVIVGLATSRKYTQKFSDKYANLEVVGS